MRLLQELRYVAHEVGLHEARQMPTEVRAWWIGEMQRERAERSGDVDEAAGNRKRVTDVPRGRR